MFRWHYGATLVPLCGRYCNLPVSGPDLSCLLVYIKPWHQHNACGSVTLLPGHYNGDEDLEETSQPVPKCFE